MSSGASLFTKDAIKKIYQGSTDIFEITHGSSIIIKVSKVDSINESICSQMGQFRSCSISDDEFHIKALLHDTIGVDLPATDVPTIIAVSGFVTSDAPGRAFDPIICITDYSIMGKAELKKEGHMTLTTNLTNGRLRKPPSPERMNAGEAGTFFSEKINYFTDEEIAGLAIEKSFGDCTQTETIQILSEFIGNHKAMEILSSSNGGKRKLQDTHYMGSFEEFSSSQMKSQVTSLSSSSRREDSEGAIVERQYMAALALALQHAESSHSPHLSPQVLCEWHKELGGGGLMTNAGSFREKQVKAGRTFFTPFSKVPEQMEKFCTAFHTLESRVLASNRDYRKPGFAPVLLAAAALFGVVDIHPFADGNGRLARIAAMWALRRAGLPFVVNLFANQSQRVEFVIAIQKSRQQTRLATRGAVSPGTFMAICQCSGLLKPLVDLILIKIERAISEFHSIISKKCSGTEEEKDDKAAKRFREKAAAGNCFICFDESPNIATLCCGKAVHLNCIAEWLSTKNTCPQCRGPLPTLPRRVQGPVPRPVQMEGIDTDFTDFDETESTDIVEIDEQETTDTTVIDEIESTDIVEIDESETTEIDETTDTIEINELETADTTEIDEVLGTSELSDGDIGPSNNGNIFCIFACPNRAAQDCVHGACASCCRTYGNTVCDRHQVF